MTILQTGWEQLQQRVEQHRQTDRRRRTREETMAREGRVVWLIRCVDGVYRDHLDVAGRDA